MSHGNDAFEARNSPGKKALAVLGSVAFVALGLWLVGAFGPDHPTGVKATLGGWACIIFFGGLGLMGARAMFDRSVVLRIDRSGIWSKGFSEATVPWSAITEMSSVKIERQKYVGLGLADPDRYPRKGVARLASATNAMTMGYPMMIGVAGTDRSFAELEDAIARHLSAGHSDQAPHVPEPAAPPSRPSFGRRATQ